jgi:hypothetical protein
MKKKQKCCDDEARAWYERSIRERYPKIRVFQPGPGQTIEA